MESIDSITSFCTLLRKLVKDCELRQKDLAAYLKKSEGSVSDLLNGKYRNPPPVDDIRKIIEACASRCPRQSPRGYSTDWAWWRGRYTELENAFESERLAHGQAVRPEPKAVHPETVRSLDFHNAIETFAGGRTAARDGVRRMMGPQPRWTEIEESLALFVEGLGARVRKAHGTERALILHSATMVMSTLAFLDSLPEALASQVHVGQVSLPITESLGSALSCVNLGSLQVCSHQEIAAGLRTVYLSTQRMMSRDHSVRHLDLSGLADAALARYESFVSEAAHRCPELAASARLSRRPSSGLGMAGLGMAFTEFATGGTAAITHQALLSQQISEASESEVMIPRLATGYVNPHFRIAGKTSVVQLASDGWWERQPLDDDIEGYLTAHLLSSGAYEHPLVVLGHPGSGKSLLTKLIAAQLPEREFRPIRVELRHVTAVGDVQQQIEQAIHAGTGVEVDWPTFTKSLNGAVPVILLDGFDELVQASSGHVDPMNHWRYLDSIVNFQTRQAAQGLPAIVIVTSRTVVAHLTDVPKGSKVIRLEPFNLDQIERWLEIWNDTNHAHFSSRGILPLGLDVVRPYLDLACQPILLLMLALYDSIANSLHRLQSEPLGRAELYRQLLTEFVSRQITKRFGSLPPEVKTARITDEVRQLGVIALGMFNRGRQSLTQAEADADLRALLHDHDEGAVDLLFGRFFFVHEAQAALPGREARVYEFLHATFGEYLAADFIVHALHDVDGTHSILRDILSHRLLTDRSQVVADVAELLNSAGLGFQRALIGTLRDLLAQGSTGSPQTTTNYTPTHTSWIIRHAVFEANLLLLWAITAGRIHVSEFVGTADPVRDWSRRTQFWRSQLSGSSWASFLDMLSLAKLTPPDQDGRPDILITLRTADGSAPAAPQIVERLSALCDDEVDTLLILLEPLVGAVPGAFTGEKADAVGGRSLVEVLCQHPKTGAWISSSYEKATRILPDLRPGAVLSLIRQLSHDARYLDSDTLLQVIKNLPLGDLSAEGSLHLPLTELIRLLKSRDDEKAAQARQILERLQDETASG